MLFISHNVDLDCWWNKQPHRLNTLQIKLTQIAADAGGIVHCSAIIPTPHKLMFFLGNKENLPSGIFPSLPQLCEGLSYKLLALWFPINKSHTSFG
jgi:hypothetical protein